MPWMALGAILTSRRHLEHPSNAQGALKPLHGWFTFENRCMVCGVKFAMERGRPAGHFLHPHLQEHCDDGVLKKWGRFYEQIKAHPVGFPGILLPREMEWSR